MSVNSIIILATIIPFLHAQIYFPDERNGGYMDLGQAEAAAAPAFAAAPLPAPPKNLTEIRGTVAYDQYIEKLISQGTLKLTLAVQKALTSTSKDDPETIVYAPVSIAGALALILLGSNGKTFAEVSHIMGLATGVNIENKSQLVHEQFGRMIQKLQYTSGFDIGRQVRFATGIFLQEGYPIRSLYKETAEAIYSSEVLNVDFEGNPDGAKQKINSWVSDRTSGKIKQMLSDNPSSATKVILASAMYFKAEWEQPFFEGATKQRPFFTEGRKSKSVVMAEMMSNGGNFPYYKDKILNCEILGFPYKGNHTTMYVVMPNHSNKDNLKQLESQLTYSEIERLVDNVKYTEALILFPKMHIDSTIDLRKSLQAIGVKTLFNPAQANLALISPGLGKQQEPLASASYSSGAPNANNDIFIFSRNGQNNCTEIFNQSSGVKTCKETTATNNTVAYKKFGSKVGRRIITNRIAANLTETLDNIRQDINSHPNPDSYENPGLYADNVIHKVYMDITETGTEAAAATSVSLSRTGGRVTFRVDVPFFFFIMHEETKTVLFWGTVNTPTPNFK